MYREIINIIDKKICELNRDKGAQFYKARHAENADDYAIKYMVCSKCNNKAIKELSAVLDEINKLEEEKKTVVVKGDGLTKLNTIHYKGGENIDEVIKWIGDNIDYKECTIHQYREYRDSPFESKLETPEGVIPVGSRLVKTKSGKLSYIPRELFDEDVFICLEDD